MSREGHQKRYSQSARSRVLYLTNNLPAPPISGGQLRELQLLKRLRQAFEVHLVAFVRDAKSPAAGYGDWAESVTLVEVQEPPSTHMLPARVRSHYAPAGSSIVAELVKRINPELIHVEGYFLLHYAPVGVPTVLVEENIEYVLEAAAETYGGFAFGGHELTRAWEMAAWGRADCCVTVTKEDAQIVMNARADGRVICVGNGIDHLKAPNDIEDTGRRDTFLYFANFGWLPSSDAAVYLLEDIWPDIYAADQRYRLVLAGAGMTARLADMAQSTKGIEVYGQYGTLAEFQQRAPVFLFPLRFGGGIKVKLIEAISWLMPVVTTSAALQGFPKALDATLDVYNDRQAFASAAVRAQNRPERGRRALAARAAIQEALPTWDKAASELAGVWKSVAGC